MKHRTIALVVIFGIVSALIAGVYWVKKHSLAGCAFLTESPADQFIAGPHTLDRNWRIFHLDKPFETIPFPQHLFINANPLTYDLRHGGPGLPESPEAMLMSLTNGRSVIFEVMLITDSDEELTLRQSSSGYRYLNGVLLPNVGYSVGHPDSGQIYLPPGLVIRGFKARASHSIEVDSFEWRSILFHHDPCREWSDVDVNTGVYHPGDPQPQRGRVTIDDEIPPPVYWERKPVPTVD